jgi:hypothetical protein
MEDMEEKISLAEQLYYYFHGLGSTGVLSTATFIYYHYHYHYTLLFSLLVARYFFLGTR